MPQIQAEHRGALTHFLNARGVEHIRETVSPDTLKPTQAEFSTEKVKKAMGFEGGDRSILVSSDGYVLDGHHQWLAKVAKGEPVGILRLNAPIDQLVQLAHDFPSSRTAEGAAAGTVRGFTPLRETEAIQAARTQQMAPGASYTGFIQDNRLPAADATTVGRAAPLRREDILVDFAKDLGASLYTGRIKGKNTLGFFRRGNEEVRIRKHADLETTAHEMAHLIDARVPELSRQWRSNATLREELKSISYDQTKVSEGFAEGVRLWMTQPEELQQRAPLVHAWLENFATTDKRYGPTMLKAREGMLSWFGQDALDRARSKIGDHRPLSEAMNGILDRFRQATVDDLHGAYRMERDLTGKIEPVGAYETARLSRASASIADGAVRYGYPVKNADGSFTYRGKGLQDILKPVAERLDDALLYFVGRSAQELRIQGREHLFTPGEIRGMLGLATPEFRKAFAEYQAFNRGVLDFAEAHGVLNPRTRALWKRTEYLPFHRVSQPGGMKGKPGDWAGIQALTGGTENIRDVLGNMLGNAAMLIDRAVKNEARLKIAQLASRPGGGKFMTKIPPGARPVKIGGDQVLQAMFERYGIKADGDAASFEFLLTNQPPAGGNVVAVLKGGEPVWYEVADPILYRALSAIDRPPMDWLTKWLGLPKRIGQAAITLTPDFMIANIARDTLMGAIMSRSGFRPVLDSIRGMQSRITQDQTYRDFLANGGGLSSLYLDEGHLRAKLEKFYNKQGIDYRTVLDAPDKLMGFIETLGDAFEASTRLGEYRQAIARGEHPRHAAYQGREVSTDFAMRGDSKALGFLYDTVMFLRPAVVSFDRLARGLAHDPNRAAIGAKAAMLALTSVGLYLLNRNDPRYADLPDWDRDANWHFFVGDQHFRYPKIWEIGALASVAERTTEKLMDADPLGLGKDFARIIGNTFSLNLMPQIAAPLVEQATNRNSFTGAPIETPGMENVQPFLRAKSGTSETMKALGMATRDMPESLQVNPARAEALLRGYLSTWAMYGLMLTDRAFFNDRLPSPRTDQLPVVRRFYAQEPAQHTRFEDQFYDMLGEADRLQGTLRALDRMGRPEIADQKELSPLAGEAKPLGRAAKSLQGINGDMLATRRDQTLTPAEKRQRLDALTVERNQLLKDAVMAAKAAQHDR
ncbi:MAG: LPD38 domain-containing protein [Rhodocyclaceae bacterium]|nr:LPD38 domain-containing protein [Rhodocyclaceae bacterium]